MTKTTRRVCALAVCTVSALLACSTKSSEPLGDAGLVSDAATVMESGVVDAAMVVPDADTCLPHAPPFTAQTSITIAVKGANFGDHFPDGGTSANAWMNLGYNLDGLCTHTADTNVCTAPMSGSKVVQQDGVNGTDNAFGHVVLPQIKMLTTQSFFATAAVFIDITSGSGSVFVGTAQNGLTIPVAEASVSASAGGSGTFSGIIPTSVFLEEVRALAGRENGSFCSGATIDAFLTTMAQSSDIGADGSQKPGALCNGISIGFTFTASEAGGLPLPLPNKCSQ
jgi:hypothetical protein